MESKLIEHVHMLAAMLILILNFLQLKDNHILINCIKSIGHFVTVIGFTDQILIYKYYV